MTMNPRLSKPSTAQGGLLSLQQLAQLLGVCTRTVRRMVKTNKLPRHVELGRLFKWKTDEIHQWIDAGCPNREEWELRQANKSKMADVVRDLRGDKSA
jgi:excisionase family DNA binding protein